MPTLTKKNTTKRFYIRIAFVILGASILAGALEYGNYLREQSRRQDLIRSTVHETLKAIGH